MAREFIEKQDSLNQGREKLNRSIDRSYDADTKSDKAIKDSGEALTTSQSVRDELNQVVIDGDSSVEAAQARVGQDGTTYSVLKERLDSEHEKVTTQLAQTATELDTKKLDKNSGAITSADLSQEVKEQMTGGSVAVVGKDTVLNENVVNNQLTNNKMNLSGVVLPKMFPDIVGVGSTRARLENEFFLEEGSTIVVEQGSRFEYSVTGDISVVWTGVDYEIEKPALVDFEFRKTDNTSFTEEDLQELQKEVYIVTPYSVTNYDNVLKIISKEISDRTIEDLPVDVKIVRNSPANNSLSASFYHSPFFKAQAGDKFTLPSDSRFEFTFIDENNASKIAWSKEYRFSENARWALKFRKADRTSFTLEDLSELKQQVKYYPILNLNVAGIDGSGNSKVVYVSPTGDDVDNDGLTRESPFETLQKALDRRADTILMERGVYTKQSAVAPSGLNHLTILPYDSSSFDDSNPKTSQKIVFEGGDYLDSWEAHDTIYRQPLLTAPNFQEVFIGKTLPPMTTGSRPAPNAVLWESKDFEIDYMMTPVLSLAECETTSQSFYWDGTHVYINPIDIDNNFILPQVDNGIRLTGVNKLTISEVVAQNYLNQPFALEKINHLESWDCEAHRSAKTDGFSLDFTYGVMHRPKANKNRNDGFNNHFQGDITIYDIEARNNMDDGASPHEGCSLIIHGGIIEGSGKGGLIPANGAFARAYNVIFKDNAIGFHNANTSLGNSISSGNLYIDNRDGIRNDSNNSFTSINDIFTGNTEDVVGNLNKY